MNKIKRYLSLSIIIIFMLFASFTIIKVNASDINYNVEYDYNKLLLGIPSGYYDSLDLDSDYNTFKNDLYEILSENYTRKTYDDVSKILHISDMDPDNNKNVIGLYTGLSLSGGWNREHVWSKSHGFDKAESSNPYTDAHHLRATNQVVNSTRNNSDYGEVDHNTASHDIYGNYWTSNVFEPRDEVKGDCARMIFYIAIRYYKEAPFNAKIVEGSSFDYYKNTYANINDPKDTGFQSNGEAVFGYLSTLLKWHYQDPVNDTEIYRNNVVYEFQHNRNPFIDHPEYVEKCFDVSGINGYNVDTTINNSEMDSLKSRIDSLNYVVNGSNYQNVFDTYDLYNSLNNNEKQSLPKAYFDKLMMCLKNARDYKNDLKNSENIKTFNFSEYVVDGQARYLNDIETTFNECDFYLSNAHAYKACYNYQFSLGYNNSHTLDKDKFPFINNDYGDYLRLKTVQENVKKIEFFCPALYRNASNFKGWYIAYGDMTNGYEKLASGNTFTYDMSVELESPISGEIVLIVTGSTACVSLSTLTLTYDMGEVDTSIDDIKNNDTLSSIAYRYGEVSRSANMTLPNSEILLSTSENNASLFGFDSDIFSISYINTNISTSKLLGDSFRLYKYDEIIISSTQTISSIVVEDVIGFSYTNGQYSLDGTNYFDITSGIINVNNNTIYLKATNAQVRFTVFTVNYKIESFDDLRIRFGSVIRYSEYQNLITNHNVTGYGVFLAKSNTVPSITNLFNECLTLTNDLDELDNLLKNNGVNISARRTKEDDLYVYRTNEDGQDEILDGDYIMFSAFLPLEYSNKDVRINALSYFIVDGNIVLLNEKEATSFKDVALAYLLSSNYEEYRNSLSQIIK